MSSPQAELLRMVQRRLPRTPSLGSKWPRHCRQHSELRLQAVFTQAGTLVPTERQNLIMTTHLITYDLNQKGQDYDALYEAIKAQGEHIHPMQNLWFVRSDKSNGEIRDELKEHIDSNDDVWVSTVNGWAASGLSNETYRWLKGEK